MRKKILVAAVAGLMALTLSMPVFAGEWKKDGTGWWYQNDDGGYPSNGWTWVDGICYYFTPEGYCLINTQTPDGYMVDASGAWVVDGVVQTQDQGKQNTHISKSQIIGEYEYYDGKVGGYYDGEVHYSHVYTLVLNENNTFEYTYDNYYRVYNESGTYIYDEKEGVISFSNNPYIIKGIIKDGGILISEHKDGDIFFISH